MALGEGDAQPCVSTKDRSASEAYQPYTLQKYVLALRNAPVLFSEGLRGLRIAGQR